MKIQVKKLLRKVFLVLTGICPAFTGLGQQSSPISSIDAIPVDNVFSGLSVGFDILTTQKYQYVCYYDTSRNMTIAQRKLNSKTWKKTKLPSVVGWDSHNNVTMVIDRDGFIHVAGNMHARPLVYFRSAKPEDIDTFEKLPMTGKNEDRVTYPLFFKDFSGNLFFQYRNGGSGNGITYWNRYDTSTGTWSPAFDKPLFDGENEASAYSSDPIAGPDGYFHIVYMWRQTPIANTNHNLSYIRSKDLVHWENAKGEPLTLPVQWRNSTTIADPVDPWNGLINMGFGISWDDQKQLYITYHKFDRNGVSQAYAARYENDGWHIYQLSNWPGFTWDLNRGGSINGDVRISGVKQYGPGLLQVNYSHKKYGSGKWILDQATLRVKDDQKAGQESGPSYKLPDPRTPQSDMRLHRVTDNTGKFIMQWQTVQPNQDRAPKPPYPAPSDLVVYKIQ
ncbi:hypothetical protein FW774_13515 [Pedobacter sp. BS3]|uniref:BNR repeat-containing protein n=1 Tax=Pedobacter sp. BS3 TaxID=2567937 RepID=UPI0011EC41BD|nr:BNR repeat-containing protein [Pedobacter sp. BS3]TZF82524.1 hypothetical protein FW774_13515 [Pedobacter sp. BS3]